jgi:hypothetical protein
MLDKLSIEIKINASGRCEVNLDKEKITDKLLFESEDKLEAIKKARKQVKYLCTILDRDLLIAQREEEQLSGRF